MVLVYSLLFQQTAHHLGGSGGPGGADSQSLQGWLLRFGPLSHKIQIEVAEFTQWMCSEKIPWPEIRGFMAGCLIDLDKGPGVCPIGIGELWQILFAKTMLHITGSEATHACGIDQLCAGLSSGVEGGIGTAHHLIEQQNNEEYWGFLLVDATNAFNLINRYHMLWVVLSKYEG